MSRFAPPKWLLKKYTQEEVLQGEIREDAAKALVNDSGFSGLDLDALNSPGHVERFVDIHLGILRLDVPLEQGLNKNVRNRNAVDAYFLQIELASTAIGDELALQEKVMSPADDCVEYRVACGVRCESNLSVDSNNILVELHGSGVDFSGDLFLQ